MLCGASVNSMWEADECDSSEERTASTRWKYAPPSIYPQHRANIITPSEMCLLLKTLLKRALLFTLIRCSCARRGTSIEEKGAQGEVGESGSEASFMTWGLQPASAGTAGDAEMLLDKGRGEQRRVIMQLRVLGSLRLHLKSPHSPRLVCSVSHLLILPLLILSVHIC